MIKAALVGLGWWGQTHIRATVGSEKIKFTRGIDIAPDNARDFCDEYGLELSSDYADALSDPEIDAVFLANAALAACRSDRRSGRSWQTRLHRKTVCAEKSRWRARRGGRRSRRHSARPRPQLPPFTGAVRKSNRLIDSGKLGELHHLESNLSHDGSTRRRILAAVRRRSADWRHHPLRRPHDRPVVAGSPAT